MKLALILAVLLLAAASNAGRAADSVTGPAARVFAASLNSPPLLRAFLFRMPKGADLHQHLSGSAYAEDLVSAGATRGLCVEESTARVVPPPCTAPDLQSLSNALKDARLYTRLLHAWSMLSFQEANGLSSHDHFFNAFALLNGAADLSTIEADSAERAGRQRLQYLELMTTFEGRAVRELGRQMTWTGDFEEARGSLMALGLPALVDKARADAAHAEQRRNELLKCGSPQASEGCGVKVRYLEQVTRTAPANEVFAQALFGFLLTQADPNVVGVNFVAPEDAQSSLANYTLHMQMLDYLHGLMPNVGIALHAGELTLGLVPPRELRSHIRQAVELGHARRIGHGVDIMFETNPFQLLHEMAARHVAVEINLTSNAAILGVRGNSHPFPVYMAAQVPTVISTDDEGIERTDLTNELQIAVTDYKLNYPTLVGLQRNSLEYAFIGGLSLWSNPAAWQPVKACAGVIGMNPSATCAAFLRNSEKARLQWQLEQQLRLFETEAASFRVH